MYNTNPFLQKQPGESEQKDKQLQMNLVPMVIEQTTAASAPMIFFACSKSGLSSCLIK